MGLDVAFSLATLIITNAMSPVTMVTFSDLFLSSVRFSLIKLDIQLFLFFATPGAIPCAIRDTEWIDRQKDVRDGLDVNRCIHLRVESVSRNVIADHLFALQLFVYSSSSRPRRWPNSLRKSVNSAGGLAAQHCP